MLYILSYSVERPRYTPKNIVCHSLLVAKDDTDAIAQAAFLMQLAAHSEKDPMLGFKIGSQKLERITNLTKVNFP